MGVDDQAQTEAGVEEQAQTVEAVVQGDLCPDSDTSPLCKRAKELLQGKFQSCTGTCQWMVEPLEFPDDTWDSWKAAHVYHKKTGIQWEVATVDFSTCLDDWCPEVATWVSKVATYGTGIDWFTCATLCARLNTRKGGQRCAQIKYNVANMFCFLMPPIDNAAICTDAQQKLHADGGWQFDEIEWYGAGGSPDPGC